MNATTLNQHCPQTGIDIPVDIPSDIPSNNDELVVAITTLAGHINAAQHRFLKLLAALVERNAWGDGGGIKSPAHWLNYYCGIDLGAAREKVRVAKCLAELPQIDAAFASGAISYSKVRAMTRSATPQNEAYLLNIARHGTAQHMEMLVRKYQRSQRLMQNQGKNTDGDTAAAQFAGRELHWHYDDDGMLVIRGRLTPEDGAMFIKALDGAFAQLQPSDEENDLESDFERDLERDIESGPKNVSAETFSAHQAPVSEQDVSAETPADSLASEADTFPQKRADALMLLAEQSFLNSASDLTPLSPPQRHQLVIHIEKDSLNQGAAHHCSIEQGPFLSPAIARRLACDTGLLTVLEDKEGNVLNVGRKTRSISPAMRRALTRRDCGCRFPGCTETRFVDAHHIHHWCDGGETRLENLVLLCRRHHRLVHEQNFELINHGSGNIEFRRPGQQVLPQALFPQFGKQFSELFSDQAPDAERLAIERQHQHMGLDINEFTAITRWQGEQMDYSMAVAGMQNL
ncbi:MAG: DUF222 domain-containing protein [Pseudohongiella sp.]|uniref:HNH endonuclease signature motif containing protein n=1 Tax=Pseudohongiella sp. TaxID=1979412 RepID=UPI0034A060A1